MTLRVKYRLRNPGLSILLLVILQLFFITYIQVYEGGIIEYFFASYRVGIEQLTSEKIINIISIFGLSSLLSVLILDFRSFSFWQKGFIVFCFLLNTALFAIGGHRNLVLWLLSPVIMMLAYSGIRFSFSKVLVITAILYPFAILVGVFRNFGLLGLDNFLALIENNPQIFDPSSQELITTYSSYTYWRMHDLSILGFSFLESYWMGFINLIPTFILKIPNRSISTALSNQYAPKGEGLGFSFNLEALVNFGIIGPIIVYGIMAILCLILFKRIRTGNFGRITFFTYLLIPAIAFNTNRIDFGTTLKMSLIRVVLSIFFAFIVLKSGKEVKQS
jgi:oligosaccharide repeat unit polymerase